MPSELRFLLLRSADRPALTDAAARLEPKIALYGTVEVRDLGERHELERIEFDVAVVLGGDGSILRAAHQMGRRQRPVVGVNMGRLGFLAHLSEEEFLLQLPLIGARELPVIEHLMFECQLVRNEKIVVKMLGLNEAAVLAGPPFAILEVNLYVDAEWVTTYSCDGLLISTPVGSTAHSLSAGGPVLRQDLQAFLIAPISPHTLTNRPVVDSADRAYEMEVPAPHPGTSLVVDGQVAAKLAPGDRIRVERAEATFRQLLVPGHGYYQTLREKLGWGGRLHFPDGRDKNQ